MPLAILSAHALQDTIMLSLCGAMATTGKLSLSFLFIKISIFKITAPNILGAFFFGCLFGLLLFRHFRNDFFEQFISDHRCHIMHVPDRIVYSATSDIYPLALYVALPI